MTVLEWDQAGNKFFETGVDRGVLYLLDGTAIPWNGLTSVIENATRTSKVYYIDGQKYLDYQVPTEFSADLSAFTYPEEFDAINGTKTHSSGIMLSDQPASNFHLSYRTRVGNDIEGVDYGYRIHILYNVQANLSQKNYATENDSPNLLAFSWGLTTTPGNLVGFKATSHISFDSRFMTQDILNAVEEILYGTDSVDPSLPLTVQAFVNKLIDLSDIFVVDNGDGTWTASGPDDSVYLTDSTTFEIDNIDATYSDPDTYTISTTLPAP